ncbi:hypothetical protein FVEG_16654 [Fusarium verticillioides 7600]|uniref:Uncharacterized protein n=1 Tax=Gibberella moniliformis (strain M3125 / FGSC 7600) TaxID=334819 RepID=W7MI73_GIBM7|nr:hypothetical protein FVEG_16654 [Fusarium verticillioides 7600]EWG50566.1 hypothetical protein FVEG_16654 [Fusarium verticillioides 7600]
MSLGRVVRRWIVVEISPLIPCISRKKEDKRAEFTYDCGRRRCNYLHEAMDVCSATFNRWNLFRALDPKEACTETSMVRPYPISLRVNETFAIRPPRCPGQIYSFPKRMNDEGFFSYHGGDAVPGRIISLSYCSLHDGGTSHPAKVALGSLTPTPTTTIKTHEIHP